VISKGVINLSSDALGKRHKIVFDDSGLDASLNYLQNRSDESFRKLVSAPGNRLAYAHYLWSSYGAKATIEGFWSAQLSKVSWSPEFECNINAVKTYLVEQEEMKWLREVLRYLPRRHFFNTTVYLNIGYDNIVFGENVALDLNFHQFNLDKRESIYYLIHELAHAGYVRYHPLPELWNISTNVELLNIIRFLTQLEGMGVISALRLRVSEDGLLDNDYKILLNDAERAKRVSEYFRIFRKLESNINKKNDKSYFQLFEKMSGKETRLWYITGCHMAQEIERHRGLETLRKLVKQGSKEFFNAYLEIAP
jgi:hypothetical protein